MRDMVERVAPGHALHAALVAADHRVQQAVGETKRLAERRALRAQPAEIGGMIGIARYRSTTPAVGRRQDAATDAAIGAGGADGAEIRIDDAHVADPVMPPLNEAPASGRTSCRSEFSASAAGYGSIRDTTARHRYRRSGPR